MTVREFIELLQREDGDAEVLLGVGDWGNRPPSIHHALVSYDGDYNWEVGYPEVAPGEDEPPRKSVVLIKW